MTRRYTKRPVRSTPYKRCSTCREYKHEMEFSHNKGTKDGFGNACKACIRNYSLKRKFGITEDQYQKMYVAQNGRCKICGTNNPGNGAQFHVDHDHKTGKVRSLLCTFCNRTLGNLGDDAERFQAFADYLRSHSGDSCAPFTFPL